MRKILQYLLIVLKVGFPILFSNSYTSKYLKHPERYTLEEKFARIQKLIRKVVKAFKVDVHIINPEYKEELQGRYLTISNHLSMFEALVYIAVSDKPITFAAKEETLNMPFVGKIFRCLNGVALDRKNVMNQLAEIKQIVNQIKNESMPLMFIFPEGTRNKTPEGKCLEYKGGSLKLAYMAKVPILPISTFGSFRILSKKHYLKRYPIFIKYDKPIYPDDYKDIAAVDLATKIQLRTDENVNGLRLLDKVEIEAQDLSKKRKEKETSVDDINA